MKLNKLYIIVYYFIAGRSIYLVFCKNDKEFINSYYCFAYDSRRLFGF